MTKWQVKVWFRRTFGHIVFGKGQAAHLLDPTMVTYYNCVWVYPGWLRKGREVLEPVLFRDYIGIHIVKKSMR